MSDQSLHFRFQVGVGAVRKRRRLVVLGATKALIVGFLSAVVFVPEAALALPSGDQPSVPGRTPGAAIEQPEERGTTAPPKTVWPEKGVATVAVPGAGASRRSVKPSGAEESVVAVRAANVSTAVTGRQTGAPAQVRVEVLDRRQIEPFGGLGIGLRVARNDGGQTSAPVEAMIDYSGFGHAYGGSFGDRLRLVKLPPCAVSTPERPGCATGEPVPGQRNDTATGTVTAVVEAAPQIAQISGMAALAAPAVYALVSGSSSDAGDYRASPTNPSGKWDVSLGSGAFTYQVPIEVPKPPTGVAPELALTYNSQSIDGRTSASNNQASWVGMGWDLNVGAIERKYRNCTQDGHPGFGDLCWDSPNSAGDPNGAVYTVVIGGVTSELIQDDTGTGSFRIKDDPAWRVQKMNGGFGSDNTDEYWVLTKQDGTRYYFGWGRTERLNLDNVREKTNSVLTVPVVGDDAGEPCHASFPSPCRQAWRWSLDRVVTPNEVENSYFYNKETNYYRSVAAEDKARGYDAGSYLSRIDYGWSSQISGAQLPAMIDFQHVNRCVERMAEKDPLNTTPPNCPSIDAEPESYPDVPVDLICDGPEDGESCAGKTYYPTFFQRDVLWDINVHVRDTNTSGWDLVRQYQMKYALMNPSGAIGDQLWLDYIQRRGYSGDDIDEPTINFNGEWQDNKVGSGELNFRRVNKIFTETGSTVTATYGHATDDAGSVDRQCPETGGTSEANNAYECFWQKWTPEGGTERTGWFKKFVTKRVQVDPGKADDGAPSMITDYEYDGAPGWRFAADPLVDDEDESWSEWRGYGKVLVTTGAADNRHSTYHWLYRGLNGDRTSKTDSSATRTVDVTDSEDKAWPDHAWLSGETLETSTRDNNGDSQKREWHEYWWYTTAQYTGLTDARMVRESRTTTLEKVVGSESGWRERIVEQEYDNAEKASTVFGLPMRTDEWGETGVSDNSCTEYGRAYNTDDLADDSTGTRRWMVYPDDLRHYSVSCTSVAADEAAGTPAAHMDRRTTTYYDGALSFSENGPKLVDGNPTEVHTYTAETSWRTTKAQFDAAGRVVKNWDGKNNLTTTTYTPATSWPISGVKVTTPDPDVYSTTFISRFWNTPWKTVDSNGSTTLLSYDAVGRLTKVFKPTEAANYPDGTASSAFTYTVPVAASATGVPRVATGDPIVVKSRALQSGTTYVDAFTYADGLGRERETQTVAPSGTGRTVTVTRYDSSGNVAGTSAPFYNSAAAGSGPVNPAVADIPSYTDTVSDWAGRVTLSQIKVRNANQAAGRTTTQYQGADEMTVFPASGSPTKTVKDVFNRVTKVVENLGAAQYATTYEYTRKGQLKYVHDAKGNTAHYTYDWAGGRLTAEDPDAGPTSQTYDNNGNLATTTDATGRVLTHSFDALNRPLGIKQGSTVVTAYTYDAPASQIPNGLGRVATSTRQVNGLAYVKRTEGYDPRGRTISTSLTVPDDGSGLQGVYTTSLTYDAGDHITEVQHPAIGGLAAETVTSTYTRGRLDKVASPIGTYLSGTGYDDNGRLVSRSLGTAGTGTSATRTFAYDDANGTGWLKSISTATLTGGVSAKVQDDTYTRNNVGAATALRENTAGQQQCFTYDDLQRLSGAWTTAATLCTSTPQSDFAGPDPYQTSWSYDAMGNIQSVTDKSSVASAAVTKDYKYPGYSADETAYTPDQARPHAVTSVAKSDGGSDSYTYNAAGQLTDRTVDSVASVFEWNAQDRVSQVTQKKPTGDEVTSYVYDAEGSPLMRRAPGENVLYLSGHELRKSGTAAPKATRYYSAEGTSLAVRVAADGTTDGKLTWLLSDNQASTQLMVAAVGGVVTRRRTNPFGKARNKSAGGLPADMDRGFLGKAEDDSTGLSMMGERLYDPGLGRFLSTDPVTTPYKPQTMNSYSYASNNPVFFTDPTGLGVPECMSGVITGCNNGVPDNDSVYHPERERGGMSNTDIVDQWISIGDPSPIPGAFRAGLGMRDELRVIIWNSGFQDTEETLEQINELNTVNVGAGGVEQELDVLQIAGGIARTFAKMKRSESAQVSRIGQRGLTFLRNNKWARQLSKGSAYASKYLGAATAVTDIVSNILRGEDKATAVLKGAITGATTAVGASAGVTVGTAMCGGLPACGVAGGIMGGSLGAAVGEDLVGFLEDKGVWEKTDGWFSWD